MHGDHPLRAHIQEGLEGFLRAGVNAAIAVGAVGPNRQQGNVRLPALADLGKAIKIRGVTGMIEGVTASPEDVAAEAAMRVFEEASAPMLAGSHADIEAADRLGLPPL